MSADIIVLKREEDEEEDEMEPRQALPVGDESLDEVEEVDWQHKMPATAEEYLKMVRQEARKVPDVVCATVSAPVDPAKVKIDFTLEFEDAAECSDDLLPSIEWERHFIQYFGDLREKLRITKSKIGGKPPRTGLPGSKDEDAWLNLSFKPSSKPPNLRAILSLEVPTLSEVLWTFSQILKKHEENPALLDNNGSCWLFSLLAVAEKPADPDTSAAIRSMARCLCLRRSQVTGPEDYRLPTLNILICIVGVVFGQLPTRPELFGNFDHDEGLELDDEEEEYEQNQEDQ